VARGDSEKARERARKGEATRRAIIARALKIASGGRFGGAHHWTAGPRSEDEQERSFRILQILGFCGLKSTVV